MTWMMDWSNSNSINNVDNWELNKCYTMYLAQKGELSNLIAWNYEP